MLSEAFISSIRAQPKSANTAIAKDVGIYLHELLPLPTQKSAFKKSSTPVNALAASSTHIFAAQADKAVVHVYSRERGNQEALISFPERIQCLTLVAEGVLILGTAEGRLILWEVRVSSHLISSFPAIGLLTCSALYWQTNLDSRRSPPSHFLCCCDPIALRYRIRRLEHQCLVNSPPVIFDCE
jgi:pre-rRNA-processing protein IPI3